MCSYAPTNQYNVCIWCTYIATCTGQALVCVCMCGCGWVGVDVCVYLKSFLPWVCGE